MIQGELIKLKVVPLFLRLFHVVSQFGRFTVTDVMIGGFFYRFWDRIRMGFGHWGGVELFTEVDRCADGFLDFRQFRGQLVQLYTLAY